MRVSFVSAVSGRWLISKKNYLLWFLLAMALVVILAISYYNFRHDFLTQTERLKTELRKQGQELTFNLSRYEFIPLSLSLDNNIIERLKNVKNINLDSNINAQLRILQSRIGALAIFVVDSQANIVFSSDANAPDSLVGHNVEYRSYFQHVQPGITEHFFCVGTTHAIPGYYQSNGVYQGNKKLGEVVVKVNINDLLKTGQTEQEAILLDQNGVIVSTNQAEWLYHSLTKLTVDQLTEANKEQTYLAEAILPLAFTKSRVIDDDTDEVVINNTRYIMVRLYLPKIHMTLARLSSVDSLYQNILLRIGLGAAVLIFVVVLIFILAQRNLITQLRLENQQALRDAYNRLEELVGQRTQELEEKGRHLEAEIRERIQSEQTLKNMQKELIRNEKLAVIGQLSAGLAHEINQPLAALGIMSANAVRFLDIGEHDEARTNLKRIGRLVDFIGRLSNQLRSFSRQSDDATQRVSVAASIDNAMLLLGHRFEKHQSNFMRHPPEGELWCLCNGVRLEQVLVNLIGNALEATQEQSWRRFVTARWYAHDGEAVIHIEDNGQGIPPDIMEHIFEPFFTTKKNHGLGLGLAISTDIIKSFEGSLSAENTEQGAKFTIRLPLAPETDLEQNNG